MKRTLNLKVYVDAENGLSLTVKHSESEGDPGSKETHTSETTESWGSEKSLAVAATSAIAEYFARVREDERKAVAETPIGKAIEKSIEKVIDRVVEETNKGALDTEGVTVRASRGGKRPEA